MAVYFITGKLGCGKTLCAVGKIRDYMREGRRIATNLDINLTELTKSDSRISVLRLPDKPMLYDLDGIGMGCEESDESKYGLLVLDELGTWFNSRNWNDKTRLAVIDWFLHARKKHWDIFFIVQNIDSLDSQLINALCEHLVVCKRTDRLNIPFFGRILKICGLAGKLPKIHVAKVYYGQSESNMLVDTWWYRAKDLYSAYSTDQIFSSESCGLNTVLPSFYLNNIALIEHHTKQIKQLTVSSRVQPTAGRGLKLSAVCLAFLVMFFVNRTYSKAKEFSTVHNQLFAQKPVELKLEVKTEVKPVIQPEVKVKPVENQVNAQKPFLVTPLSTNWRVSGVVANKRSGKYVYTISDDSTRFRFIDASACILDSHRQPSCLVDGEIVTFFTGHKKNDVEINQHQPEKVQNQVQEKPEFPVFPVVKPAILSTMQNSDSYAYNLKAK